MAEHKLKTWPSFFEAQANGNKTFEARLDDGRNFQVGDVLVLQEFEPRRELAGVEGYTGRELRRRVKYILRGGEFGIMPGHCILGTAPERSAAYADPKMPWRKCPYPEGGGAHTVVIDECGEIGKPATMTAVELWDSQGRKVMRVEVKHGR